MICAMRVASCVLPAASAARNAVISWFIVAMRLLPQLRYLSINAWSSWFRLVVPPLCWSCSARTVALAVNDIEVVFFDAAQGSFELSCSLSLSCASCRATT